MISRILAGVLCFAVFQLHGQFQNVTEMIGEHYVVPESFFGSGMSFYDFDRDGLDDLSIGLGTDTARFFMNDSGTFIPADFDIPTTGNGHIVMMLWADYDNDGDEDLLITKSPEPFELWQNEGNNNFVNVAAEAGIYEGYYNYGGAAFADFT